MNSFRINAISIIILTAFSFSALASEKHFHPKAKLMGNRQPYEQLKSVLVHFTPNFEMMPGTKPTRPAKSDMTPFEQEPPALTNGG